MLEKIKKINLIELLILIMPLIDVLNTITGVSLSLIYRGIFLIILLCIFVFLNKSKLKNISFSLLIFLFSFSFVFVFHYYRINGAVNLMAEITSLVKFLYLPIVSICLINYYNDKEYNVNKIILNLIFVYTIFLIVPTILGISDKSYSFGKGGFTGLFYAPNEVGAILAIASPFVIYNTLREDKRVINIIFAVLFIIACFLMGTKTPVMGLAVAILHTLLVTIIRFILNKKNFFNIVIISSILVFAIILYHNSYLIANLNFQNNLYDINNSNNKENNPLYNKNLYDISELKKYDELINFPTTSVTKDFAKIDSKLLNMIFSSRNIYMVENLNAYKNSSISKQAFGLSLYGKSNKVSGKLVELDFIDILVNYGFIGFLVLGTYLLVLAIIVFCKFMKNFKENIFDNELCANYLSFLIAFLIALIAGHTLGAPAVSIMLSLTIVYLVQKYNLLNDHKLLSIIIVAISILYIIFAVSYLILPMENKVINMSLGDDIEFKDNVILVEKKEITYNDISDTLTYYVPKDYQHFKIIYVNRLLPSGDVIKFLTLSNEEDKNILVNIELEDDYKNYIESANGLLIADGKKIIMSNSYHYNYIINGISSFNTNAVKNLLREQYDFSIRNGLVRKSINVLANSSVDSYLIETNEELINRNELLPWLSYNGIYSISNNYYIRDFANLNLSYSNNDFNELLSQNYLISLNRYSNSYNNIYYKDYEIKNNNYLNHSNIYLDLSYNYNIYNNLKLVNNSSYYQKFSNIISDEYKNNNYTVTSDGIIFNKSIDPSFANQVAILNILIENYKDKEPYNIRIIINKLLSELTNSKWLINNVDIHDCYYNDEYIGDIKDFNIINNLITLNNNLHNIGIKNPKIDNYINILYLKFKNQVSGEVLSNLKNNGYIS